MKRSCAPHVHKIAEILSAKYQDFKHYNKKNPLDELFFILCSVKRSEKVYLEAFRSLKNNFPKYELLAATPVKKISRIVSWGGLQNQKAAAAREIITRLIESFGRPTLAPLKKMSDEECEKFLTGLPGIGKKAARCVMLYSLERKVFPVDTHCWRIAQRLGWLKPLYPDGTCSSRDMDQLQKIIPPNLRFGLHINMVSLGRESCTARNPKCSYCPLKAICVLPN